MPHEMTEEEATERGYQHRIRRVVLGHVAHLMGQAADLRKLCDQRVFPEPPPGGEVEGSHYTERTLERIENLLEHAAQEVRDERLKLRDGWPG